VSSARCVAGPLGEGGDESAHEAVEAAVDVGGQGERATGLERDEPVQRAYMSTLYSGRKPDDFDEYRSAVVSSLKRSAYGKAFSLTTRQTTHDPAEAQLGEVTAPTLVIMGEKDPDFENPAA
jgi:hypothetical protein